MTLYYPLLEQPLEFGENRVNVLIIEEGFDPLFLHSPMKSDAEIFALPVRT